MKSTSSGPLRSIARSARAALRVRLAIASLSTLGAGCGPAPAPPRPPPCASPCPEGLRCYAPTGECVLSTVASCATPCATYEQCSARAAEPTCFAQVCTLPPRPPSPLLKVVALSLVPEREACDLDGDGEGDARLSDVVEGYAELPQAIDAAIASDRITILLHRSSDRLAWLFGTLAPDSLRCSPASPTAGCRYTISRESYDRGARSGPCPAWLALGDARVEGTTLRAGGERSDVGIAVPIGAQQFLLQMYGVRADGPLETDGATDRAASLRVCGSVPRSELLAALEGLPADALTSVGGLAGARRLLMLLVRPDIDGDRDGVRESVSFALRLTAVSAATTGYSPLVPRP
jgi:hypothetical protein